MTNGFIEKVAEQISDKHSRKLITAELESHLLDKIDYYVDIGYSKEDAEKRATEEMGNPDDTAVPLSVCRVSIEPSLRRTRILRLRAWKSVQLLQLVSSRYFSSTGDQYSMSYFLAAGAPKSPAAILIT